MSRNQSSKPLSRACAVIGPEHEALLRSIGGNLCDYCSQRGKAGCAWEQVTAVAPSHRQVRVPGHSRASPRGQSVRHIAAEIASHLGP